MTTDPLMIFAVCLMSAQRFKATAVYNGEQLVVTSVQQITGFFGSWRETLIQEIEEKKAAGFAVIVEERTDHIAKHATQYLLEDSSDTDSHTNLYEALDWYFAMSDIGNIIFHADCQRHAISAGGEGSKVDKRQDEKGRTVYSVDWKAFHGGYRAVLLCVVAAMIEPISERYLSEMFPDTAEEEDTHPMFRIQRALRESVRQRGRELDEVRSKIYG